MIVPRLLLGWLALASWCAIAQADGGVVRLLERKPPYEIAVFTSPTPVRAGPIDISVLVSDLSTGEPVLDANVNVTMTLRARPRQILRQAATTEAATNKLLRVALFDLPEPGWWDVTVASAGDGGEVQVEFTLEASEPIPKWRAVWPWLAWPAPVVLLFGFHQYLIWRKAERKGYVPRSGRPSHRL